MRSKLLHEGHLVGGAHLSFPGVGHIRVEQGKYAWVPAPYTSRPYGRPANSQDIANMSYRVSRPSSLSLAAALAACIFLVDTLSSLEFAVASLYVLVVLLAAHDLNLKGIILTGVGCSLLTIVSYGLMHGLGVDETAPLRSAVSLVAILITTMLVLRSVAANTKLKVVERQRANLARFFPPAIVEQLVGIDTPLSIAHRHRAAVLFADMIGFTAYSSGKTPDAVIGLLRELLGILSEAVFSHDGSIDKFLGDGLMAVFRPPMAGHHDATNAAACALEIIEQIDCWNQRHARCTEPVQVAIGIHYGDVVQGDVGTDKRLEFTVVGDTVNIASRVEAYYRPINAAVLVTGDLAQALLVEGSADLGKAFTDVGMHELRGRTEPIRLFGLKRESKACLKQTTSSNFTLP
jgi:class 3 adenylate cyclase